MNMKQKLEAESLQAENENLMEQLANAGGRPLQEFTQAYAAERLVLAEHYIGLLVNMLANFHPYLQPELSNMAAHYNNQMQLLNERHPPSGLILPPGTMRQ